MNPGAGREAGERREAPRFRVELPVVLATTTGCTHDVSASGVFFNCLEPPAGPPTVGTHLTFALLLEYADGSGPLGVHCEGEVIRVVEDGKGVGVAVRFGSYIFEAVGRTAAVL